MTSISISNEISFKRLKYVIKNTHAGYKHSDIFACVYFQKLLDEVITFCVFAWHSKMGERPSFSLP